MKKILLLVIFVSNFIFGQNKTIEDYYYRSSVGFYTYTPVTGNANVSSTDVFLYGAFTKTKADKLTGSKSASKYIVLNAGYTYGSNFSTSTDGWLVSDGQEFNKTYQGEDSCYLQLSPSVHQPFAKRYMENFPADSVYLSFEYAISNPLGTITVSINNDDYGEYIMFPTNIPNGTGWHHFDTVVTTIDYPPIQVNVYGSGVGYDTLALRDVIFTSYYKDSTRTLAKTVSLADLAEDEVFTYYASIVDAKGNYSKGADSTFTTPIQVPYLDAFQDTFEVNIYLEDISVKTNQIVYYKNGIKADSVQYNYAIDGSNQIYSDSTINEGAYYKVKIYGTNTSVLSDSFYIEPIVPFLPAPTNLTGINDTTGIKITWQDNSINEDGFYIRRLPSVSAGAFLPNIDTVASNITEYCDSLPNITQNTDYVYEIYAYKDNYGAVSNRDTLTAYYNIASSIIASIDSSVINIDTTLGSSFTPDLLGIMEGTSLADFSLRPTSDNGHTKTVSGGWYVMAFDSGTLSQETSYMQKTFTGQSDSIFAGFVIKADGDIRLYTAGDEHPYYSIYDTVNARVVAGFGIDDGTGSDGIADRWALQYWNNGALVSNDFSAVGFTDDSCRLSIKVKIGAGTGQVTFYVNDTVIDTFNTLTNNTVIANAIRIGNDASAPYGSDYAKNEDFLYDNIYVDSRGNQTGNWWTGTSTIIDTTWGNYDTTFIHTLTVFNCAEDEPPLPPVAPTGLDTTLVTSSSVLLTWDDVDFETAYYVQRKLSNQSIVAFSNVGSTTANDITYTDDTVTDSTWYTYRVYSSNANGNSAYSDTLRIFTDDVVEDVDPPTPGTYTDTLYVSASATGTGDGQSIGSPYTLGQAISSVNAGNLVLLSTGAYNIAPFISFTRSGTYSNPIEWRGTIYPSDSSGLTYSSNSTVFYNTAYNSANSSGVFRVNAPYNTFKGILMHNSNAQQFGFGVIDADATRTILDGINWKYTPSVTSSSVHSWRVYADSVEVKNSYFNRGARCIIWVTTNGDGANTIKSFLLDGNVFTGAGDVDATHGAVQFMPNTATVDPNWLEDVTIRNNTFIGNTTGWNLHMRYFRRANVYNNLFVNSGGVFVNDRHYPNMTDSLNSEGSLFVYNTIVNGSGGTIAGINRQMNGIVFANNLQTFTASPSYIWRFTNLAVGEEPFNQRHFFDYNFFDIIGSGSISSVISSWNTASDTYINVNWTAWKALGFDNNTVIDVAPTFLNTTYYKPLNASSPQVGIGIPITTANGFRINITTDRFGNIRSATNPTAGWAE
jgi:hypothetical protein